MASTTAFAFKILSSLDMEDCRTAVTTIQKKNVIALDAVDVDKDWPLTLLSVALENGNVLLFDILRDGTEPDGRFLKDTGLDAVLTSSEIVKLQWNKKERNFWAKRPLAQEKIDYACSRVASLIPNLYQEQKRYLEENKLLNIFAERVQEEIDFDIDPVQKARRNRRLSEQKKEVLTEIVELSLNGMDRAVLTDRNKKFLINQMSLEEILYDDHPEAILELKMKLLEWFLKSLEQKMKYPGTFYLQRGMVVKLNDITSHGTDGLRERATNIKTHVLMIYADDIQEKYGADTGQTDLSRHDLKVLKALRPLSDSWTYPQILLDHYWRIVETGVEKDMQNLALSQEHEVLNMQALIIYNRDSQVPAYIHDKVQKIMDVVIERLPRKYGLNKGASDVSDTEKIILERLDVINEMYDPVVVRLHWEVTYDLLCDESKTKGRRKPWLAERINFLSADDRVPDKIKQKAEQCQKGYQ